MIDSFIFVNNTIGVLKVVFKLTIGSSYLKKNLINIDENLGMLNSYEQCANPLKDTWPKKINHFHIYFLHKDSKPKSCVSPPLRVLYAPPPPPKQELYAQPQQQKSQDVRSTKTQLKSMFVTGSKRTSFVYPNGHHFPCMEPMWC